MTPWIKEDYRLLSLPDDEDTVVAKTAFAVSSLHPQVVTVDSEGAILDGFTEWSIVEEFRDHGVSESVRVLAFSNEEQKKQWIAGRAHRAPDVRPGQMHLANFNTVMYSEGSTIDEKIKSLADKVVGSRKIESVINALKNSYEYGSALEDDRLLGGIREYVRRGGAMSYKDIITVRKLDKKSQDAVLEKRKRLSIPWSKCIDAVNGVEAPHHMKIFKALVNDAKLGLGPLARWVGDTKRSEHKRMAAHVDTKLLRDIQSVLKRIRHLVPLGVCQSCSGRGCKKCKMTGFVVAGN